MAQELIYTSYPKGVKPGVSGFCTVAVSPNLAPNMISRLEGLSGYRHLFMPGTPEAELNPANWAHVVINVGNTESHVVYRVADAGLDYTGRSNKLAHFIVLDKNEHVPCGPAALLSTPGLIDLKFDQQVGTRPFNRPIPHQLISPRPCVAWRNAAGDPGWAGELAKTAWTGKYACIVYKPGMNVLALIQEAMALLPPERRWKTTFSTYYAKMPTGVECQWRCVVAGTPEAAQAIAEVGSGLVIDLSNGALAPAEASPAVMAARAGRIVLSPTETKSSVGAEVVRPRPVQTLRPVLTDETVNAGIQEELEAIDSSSESAPEDELLNALDTMPLVSSLELKRTVKPNKKANSKVSGLAAMIAGVFIAGIAVGALFVMLTAPRNGNNQMTSSGDVNLNNTTEPSGDVLNPYLPGEKVDDKRQAEPPADIPSKTDDELQPPPVDIPSKTDDELQPPPEDIPSKTEPQQPAPPAPVEQPKTEPQQPTPEDIPSKTEPQQPAPPAPVEQPNTEPQQPAPPAPVEQPKTEPQQPPAPKVHKYSSNEREKIYKDERWAGTDRDYFFIYVGSKDSGSKPDCTRLNMQLQEKNMKITDLKLIQLVKKPATKFRFQQVQEDKSKYIVEKDDNSGGFDSSSQTTGIVIQLLDRGDCIEVIGDGPIFKDLSLQYALLATFSDSFSHPPKIISFFYEESGEQSKSIYKKINVLNSKNDLTLVENLRKGTLNYNFTADESMRSYRYKNIKAFGYGKKLTVFLPRDKDEGNYKTFNITPSEPTVIDPDAPSSINVEINYDYNGRVGNKPQTVQLKDLVFDKIHKSETKDWLSIKVYAQKDTGDRVPLGDLSDEKKAKEYDSFINTIKQITLDLPLYIDFYIQLDKVGNQSAVKPQDGTGMPFLWKRVKFPPQKD